MSGGDNQTFDADRQAMAEIIAVHARLCAEMTGRERLSSTVMDAMRRAPRHKFVPSDLESFAYEDTPLPIGFGKTISQPFIVALMTDILDVEADDKILEIGTGLGYQAAVLAELSDNVYSIELLAELSEDAGRRLKGAGYAHVRRRVGDGARGWPEEAPFDKIIVAAAPADIPVDLIDQLQAGGRLIAPVGGDEEQWLTLVEKAPDGDVRVRRLIPVRFSTLTLCH